MIYESVTKKLQLDIDRDSSIGFSVFTSEKSTILSEVTLLQSYCLCSKSGPAKAAVCIYTLQLYKVLNACTSAMC